MDFLSQYDNKTLEQLEMMIAPEGVFDRSVLARCIDEIEGTVSPPVEHGSHVVTESTRLRRKRIGEFTLENLRLMVGQQIAPDVLMPIALRLLAFNPWLRGDFYPGDLLSAVLRTEPEFWLRSKHLYDDLVDVIDPLTTVLDNLKREVLPTWETLRVAVLSRWPD